MPTYKFNDKQGNRDRQCVSRVVLNGQALSLAEATQANWCSDLRSNMVKNGKWSNCDHEVTVNNAKLVIFMEPFEGWPTGKSAIIKSVQESCTEYIGYTPSPEEAWLAFEDAFKGKLWFHSLTCEISESQLE